MGKYYIGREKKLLSVASHFYLLLLGQLFTKNSFVIMRRIGKKNTRLRIFRFRTATLQRIKRKRGALRDFCRSGIWWENIVLGGKFNDDDWRENFRMTRDTFDIICSELRPILKPKYNKLNLYWQRKKQLSVEKKVAICLYYLASCCEYRIVGNQFGVHKRTICKVVHEVIVAITKVLTPKYVRFPNQAEAMENASIFRQKSKIPNIIGAIDGSHIPILPPSEGYRDFINRKGWASLILQAIVGPKYQFIDISIKQPGRSHDMAAFMASSIYRNIERAMPQGTITLDERELPFVIVGDPAYPLLPWLLKGFTGANLTEHEDSFNVYMNSARVCVEIAFGRLKARWRCLLKRLDVHYTFVPEIVAACCTLHNIVEKYNEDFLSAWLEAVNEAEVIFQQPSQTENRFSDDYEGYDMRIFLTQYLAKNYPLRCSRGHGYQE